MRSVLRRERGLVLQRSAAREEGVLEVIVEQAANGGHVDISKARESAGEVGGVVVRPEETPELSVEDVLCLWPAEKKHEVRFVLQESFIKSNFLSNVLLYLIASLSLIHSLTTASDAGSLCTYLGAVQSS